MEDEISRQRETMTELARDIQKLAQGVQALQVHQQQVDAEVRLLKKAQEDDQSSRQWLTRSIIDKLIWPALAVIAAAVAVLTNKEP
jgi:hypothetical protein